MKANLKKDWTPKWAEHHAHKDFVRSFPATMTNRERNEWRRNRREALRQKAVQS